METKAAALRPPELLNLKSSVDEIAGRNPGDEKIKQRAAGLAVFFGSLAEVREHLETRRLAEAEETCARALQQFPDHPLFNAALAEAARQKIEWAAHYIAQVKQRVGAEKDFAVQAAILREALGKYPTAKYLIDESAAVNAKQQALNERVERAHQLEAKQQFGEAIKEWEELHRAYPWYQGVDSAVERISHARRKEKQDALDRWFRQVEAAIQSDDYETASAMIRQAKQQQPDRKLQSLEERLNEGLERKAESDKQLTEGRRLLSAGDSLGAGQSFLRAHELQPRDEEKAEEIAALLVTQIRASANHDFALCDKLLSFFSRITPAPNLPADLAETISRRRQALEAERANTRKMLDQLSRLAIQVERARSKRALSSLSEKLTDSGLLHSRDSEVRRVAGDLSKKLNLRISGAESPRKRESPAIEVKQSPLPPAGVAVGALLVLALSGLVFFLSRPRVSGVPVQINVRPEHATIELAGQTCVAPDCNFLLKPGDYIVNVRKDGYRPRSVAVTVRPGDTIPLNLNTALEPLPVDSSDNSDNKDASTAAFAKIEIRGALPKTRIRLDGVEMGVVSADGVFLLRVSPGSHTIDLSLDGFDNRTIKRNFARGEIVSLADGAVQLVPQGRNAVPR
jgi:tetratricopeptide (TPR) repeat protein